MPIESDAAPTERDRAEAPGGIAGRATPLYVVCSPSRCIGKTLVSRLLTEFCVLDDRCVAAFDLADEGPQLADYLPTVTTIADISDVRGQIAFFEQLIGDNVGTQIVDLSHRTFTNFFTVVQQIDFFEEARRRSIEPLILFVVAPDPKSPAAYAALRNGFAEASLVPVRNRTESMASVAASRNASPDALEIPHLGFSLRALIDQRSFSFSSFWRATAAGLPEPMDRQLCDWLERVFQQFRDLEFFLGCEEPLGGARLADRPGGTHRRRQDLWLPGGQAHRAVPPAAIGQDPRDLPEEVRKFAPKKPRQDAALDQPGPRSVAMLQNAGRPLHGAEDRFSQLQTEVENFKSRALGAEAWLRLIRKEIGEKLIDPMMTRRSKIDDLDS